MNKALLVLLAAGVVSAAADAPGGEDAARDLRRMQGDWAAESYVQDGTKLPDDDAQAIFRTVKGDKYTVSHFKRVLGKGTIKLDASKKPKAIDAYPAGKDKPILGIYEFDGDKMKLCFAAPGKERPAAFTSTEGSGHTLTVWVREKD
jgi:uncharacterized protein (TIGR03067 family)